MSTKTCDKAFGRCRCCLKVGHHKDLLKCYVRNGEREVYSDMFLDCFNLFLSTSPKLTTLICVSCVSKLVEALDFKNMVTESQEQLLREYGTEHSNITLFVNVPETRKRNVEQSNNTLFVDVPESTLHSEFNIKLEEVKEEPADDSIEFAITYDDGPEHDDLPETNGLELEPALNVLREDLVEGEAALLARFAKVARPLPLTKGGFYSAYPSFATHLDALKDRIILPEMIEKLLEETDYGTKADHYRISRYSEKSALVLNSALLLENSNLTPFRSRNRSSTFPCFYCRLTFESLQKIKEHQSKMHKKSDIRKLLSTYGSESLVVYADTTDLKCTICDQGVNNINNLKSHLTKAHNKVFYPGFTDRVIPFKLNENNIFACQICGFNLENFGSIERHMNTHYRNYVCKDCGAGFVTQYRLKVHMKGMHVEGRFPCDQCKKVFTSHQKLKNHIDTVHKLYKRFKCAKCVERFSEYFKRQRHMVEKHGVAPLQYKCNVCDKTFDRRYTLSRHMKRDHLEERDFQCDKCPYKCFTNNELRVHMIKHNGERIFECSVCKKAYARKKTLREHMRIHNNDRRFSCAVCGQAFVQKCSLKGHMKTHHMEYNMVI